MPKHSHKFPKIAELQAILASQSLLISLLAEEIPSIEEMLKKSI